MVTSYSVFYKYNIRWYTCWVQNPILILNISDNRPDDETDDKTDEEINDKIDEEINNSYELEGMLYAVYDSFSISELKPIYLLKFD